MMKIKQSEIEKLEFIVKELIRVGKHSGNETLFIEAKKTIEKLKSLYDDSTNI